DILDVLLDLRARGAPHRGERVDDGDGIALDLHLVDEAQVDDVHAELGILDDPQGREDVFAGQAHSGRVAGRASQSDAKAAVCSSMATPGRSSRFVPASASRSDRPTRTASDSARE